jgi:5,10-methylene-tetrahydrofolate dehydrogenase/methenyl tetrahydrofolate cyclohydrolase
MQLPKHIDEQLVLSAISVEKDVDGFHPLNMGRLCMKVCDSVQDKTACIFLVSPTQ